MLCVNAFLDDPNVPLIFVVSGFLAASSSMQRPTREALMPRTVQHDQIAAANSLTSLGMQIGVLVGPAVGGLLIAFVGIGWCFVVDICGLAIATLLFVAMRPYPHRAETTPPSLAGIGEGIELRAQAAATCSAPTSSTSPRCSWRCRSCCSRRWPSRSSTSPSCSGLLYSAETVGALLATALSGWTGRIHHHGRAIVIAAAAYGGFVALAGLMPSVWLMLFFFMLGGAADMISGVFRGTVWNQTIPENMRGRLAGIEMLSYSVGPLGGQVRAGVTADLWSVRGAIVSGGVACVAGVTVTAVCLRDFWSLRRAHRPLRPGRARGPRRARRGRGLTVARRRPSFGEQVPPGRGTGSGAGAGALRPSRAMATGACGRARRRRPGRSAPAW